MQTLLAWFVVSLILGGSIWFLARNAKLAGQLAADLAAEKAARETEQAMADAQANGQTSSETLDKLDKGKF